MLDHSKLLPLRILRTHVHERNVKKKEDEKGVLTTTGELIGGFDDFKCGGEIVSFPYPDGIPKSTDYVVLDDWRPLAEVVPLWRHFLPRHPRLATIFVLETGGGGDCLFHAVAAGFNHLFNAMILQMEQVRELAAKQLGQLTEDQVVEFIIDLLGRMPHQFKTLTPANRLAQLQAIVRKPGGTYWGETGTLRQLLLRCPTFAERHLGFAVINIRNKPVAFRPTTVTEQNEFLKTHPNRKKPPTEVATKWEPRVETTILRLPDTKYLLFLHCLENSHWVLLGYAPNADKPEGANEARIGTSFSINNYPEPLFPFLQEQNQTK